MLPLYQLVQPCISIMHVDYLWEVAKWQDLRKFLCAELLCICDVHPFMLAMATASAVSVLTISTMTDASNIIIISDAYQNGCLYYFSFPRLFPNK